MVYLHIIALKMNYNMLTWKCIKIFKNAKKKIAISNIYEC